MGLIDYLSKTALGYKGQQPKFNGETKESTLHYQSSTINDPKLKGEKQIPSTLDEMDTLNRSKYKSVEGKRYIDQTFT
jgi:hypothetical protein